MSPGTEEAACSDRMDRGLHNAIIPGILTLLRSREQMRRALAKIWRLIYENILLLSPAELKLTPSSDFGHRPIFTQLPHMVKVSAVSLNEAAIQEEIR